MSLINEALKRTRDAAYQLPSAGPVTVDQYRIANNSHTTRLGPRLGIVLVAALTLGAWVGMIVFFFGYPSFPGRKNREQLPSVSTVPRATVSPSSAPASSPPSTQDSQARNPSAQVRAVNPPSAKAATPDETAEDALVAKLLAKIKAEQATTAKTPATPEPEPPRLVLQGVTSQGNSREAMINGSNVREGDEIEGARVVAIEARSVKLRFGGRDLVLRMP
jgi:cytoskeletal protein RodZ